jgi:hypothetical protein
VHTLGQAGRMEIHVLELGIIEPTSTYHSDLNYHDCVVLMSYHIKP